MSTIFWNRNIVNEAHQKMKDFTAAGQNILWFAFAPPGGNHWSVVTDNTFFNRNIPGECHQKMKDLVAAGQKIVCVAFPPPGGNTWSVVTDKTFFNRNIPDECHQKMKDFAAEGRKILCVAFPPQGGNRWSVVANNGYFNRSVPAECHMIMGEISSCHGPMRTVAYDPDGNGWSVVSNGKNPVFYRLPLEDDDAWKLSNGNWDDANFGHSKGNPNGLQAYAFDFTHPEKGNIRAARGGTVHALVKSESGNSWGSKDPCNPGVGNYLVIKHSDGTVGVYWHMKKDVFWLAWGLK